jgi:aspartyl/glutamyl-tRNA(Asn/Gln) amidotransferase C subunit
VKVDASVVRHVARLARLDVAPEREERLCRELSAVLDYIDTIAAWEAHAVGAAAREPLRRRADEPVPPVGARLVDAAADRAGNEVRVPTVVDTGE